MLVVFVTHNYPRHAGDLPGAFLHPLALALRNRGHDVRVVAPSDRGQGGRDALEGVPVHRVRYAAPARETLAYEGRMQDAVKSPAGLLALARLIRALRRGARVEVQGAAGDAVLHAHWWIPGGLALPGSPPGLVTLHGTDGRILAENRLGRWLGRRVLRRAAVVTAVSAELAAVAERVSGRSDVSGHVQPMPIDASSRPMSRGGDGAVVVARLVPQKRIDVALRAVGELARAGSALPLTVIGDGPERARLEQLGDLLPRDASVRFTGTLQSDQVARTLGTADVMLFPAREEGLGLAAVEALLAGVPVVACRDGGGVVSALAKHGGGVITEPTPSAFAAGIREANTASRRAEAKRAGDLWRAELAPARVAEVFEGWYREALGG